MIASLYGNPHSASQSSQLSASLVDEARLKVLQFFDASPDEFDVVFVANATAGIKLVMDAFRDNELGFWYGYHKDSHTSLVGPREVATAGRRCFVSDLDVENWLAGFDGNHHAQSGPLRLFAYPAQSNMNGRRLPLRWCSQTRGTNTYTLLDAAALVSTTPLDLSSAEAAPDFTVLSFYKIFGFPDLGALIVRRRSAGVLRHRKYFSGGTVDMVICLKEQWHAKKTEHPHDHLEDGTLPIHSILALRSAIDVHKKLFTSLDEVSRHTTLLAKQLHIRMESLHHGNGVAACQIYGTDPPAYGDASRQGPIIAFNIRNSQGGWVSTSEVEKMASIKNIQLRTGGVCNPGGIADHLQLASWEMRDNFSAGHRCSADQDTFSGKPTGVIRVSLGAMSTLSDVHCFLNFVEDFFVDSSARVLEAYPLTPPSTSPNGSFRVESLTVYPIKSCSGYKIPVGRTWPVKREGLQWDREWCLIHQGTGAALSQKRYPQMALLRPCLDLENGVMRVIYEGLGEISVPLSADPTWFEDTMSKQGLRYKVCGDAVAAQRYKSQEISEFFSSALGVPCHLARLRAGSNLCSRHAKAHFQKHQYSGTHSPGSEYQEVQPILLSNESPILIISRSSLSRLNEQIKSNGGKTAEADVFRANIILVEDLCLSSGGAEEPYNEDRWRYLRIGDQHYRMLGSCRRCQMVCIDQNTAEKNEEPFVTLAKTRRFDGKVFFGIHSCLIDPPSYQQKAPIIRVGDPVRTFREGEQVEDTILMARLRRSKAST